MVLGEKNVYLNMVIAPGAAREPRGCGEPVIIRVWKYRGVLQVRLSARF